tara:strand:- start:2352 stop:3350 length:999 start_codon:yes stop_codon:yes gene_type:complete
MHIYYYTIIIFILTYLFFLKKKFLVNSIKDNHQQLTTSYIPPLMGGYFIVLVFLFNEQITILEKILFFSIFLSGALSDNKIINSPVSRLIFQILISLIFVEFANLTITNTRIFLLDNFLNNIYFNLFFCVFCLTILINGTNFIDGLNGLVSGYYIIVLSILFYLDILPDMADKEFIELLIFVLSLLFIINLSNKIYLGDSGSYLLGFSSGILLISIYLENLTISPYFIVLLIWYPCFENLFSISRKLSSKISPLSPDNSHLHQILYLVIKNKTNLKKNFSNNLSSSIILFYNLIILFLGSQDISNTKYQIFLLLINVFLYLLSFRYLKKINS